MTSKKIGISQPWIFDTYPYNPALLNQQKDISSLLYDIGILPSQIYISQHTYLSTYHFSVFNTKKSSQRTLALALKVLKPLLILKYNKNVAFNVKYPPSLYYDHNHIASWLKLNLQEDPMKSRPLFKTLMNKQKINAQAQKKQSKPGLTHLFKNKTLQLIKLSKQHFNNNNKKVSFNKVPKRILNLKKRPLKNRKSFSYYNNRTFQNITLSKKETTHSTPHSTNLLFTLKPFNAN